MPRAKKIAVKPKKEKLSPAERSQIAKDRWAKIKAGKAQESKKELDYEKISAKEIAAVRADIPSNTDPISPYAETSVEQEKAAALMETVPILINAMLEAGAKVADLTPAAPPVEPPAPQLAPVKAPKQKRYTGPKEFSVALKAAENRLAKAITERAEAMGKLAGLNAEIPSLIQIIQALKGSGNGFTPAPYDPTLNMAFQSPIPQPANPLAAIQAAMDAAAQAPVFRASGGAVQLSPDVVGTLEGPDDDDSDIDRYITGASGPVAEGKWIGG